MAKRGLGRNEALWEECNGILYCFDNVGVLIQFINFTSTWYCNQRICGRIILEWILKM